jgi:glutamate synthase domain-containing protein 3
MVDIEQLEQDDMDALKSLIEKHGKLTGSNRAKEILADWDNQKTQFVKVMPREYRRILAQLKENNA